LTVTVLTRADCAFLIGREGKRECS